MKKTVIALIVILWMFIAGLLFENHQIREVKPVSYVAFVNECNNNFISVLVYSDGSQEKIEASTEEEYKNYLEIFDSLDKANRMEYVTLCDDVST